jgi:hypothetical protein
MPPPLRTTTRDVAPEDPAAQIPLPHGTDPELAGWPRGSEGAGERVDLLGQVELAVGQDAHHGSQRVEPPRAAQPVRDDPDVRHAGAAHERGHAKGWELGFGAERLDQRCRQGVHLGADRDAR